MAWIECKMGNTDAIVKNVPWYATCGTAQGTQAKVATTTNSKFTLVTGAKVVVKFTYTNTATNPTLNVDSKGAKYIKVFGENNPNIWWKDGDLVEFTYDGTNWIMGASAGLVGNSFKQIILASATGSSSKTYKTLISEIASQVSNAYNAYRERTYLLVEDSTMGEKFCFTINDAGKLTYYKVLMRGGNLDISRIIASPAADIQYTGIYAGTGYDKSNDTTANVKISICI